MPGSTPLPLFRPLPANAPTALGWLRAQAVADLHGFVGHFRELAAEASSDIFVSGRVGGEPTDHWIGGVDTHWWNGETEGNWADGYVRLALAVADDRHIARSGEHLERLLASQDDDGYLGVYTAAARAARPALAGDLWTQSRALQALTAWYDHVGDDAVLARLLRAARAAHDRARAAGGANFDIATGDSTGLGHGLMITDPLLDLYERTGERFLLDFARECYEWYSAGDIGWPEADCQLPNLLSDKPFIGHGAHTCEHLRVPLRLWRHTGDERYRVAFDRGSRKLLKALGVTGACKSDECIGSPEGPDVPLPQVGYEHCAITELLITLHTAVEITGEMRYADMAERLFLNAAQAASGHDGMTVAYCFAENQYDGSKTSGTRWDMSPTHDDIAVCCAPNAARVLPHHLERMVARTADDGLAVLFYGPMTAAAEIRGARVTLTQDTEYPFTDEVAVRLHVEPATRFPLLLRLPGWADDATVAVEAATDPVLTRRPDRVVVDATWGPSSRVTLAFSAQATATTAVDGTVAVERGPLVYALDIPGTRQVTRAYALEGFHDVDVVAAPGARWDVVLDFRDGVDDALRFERTNGAHHDPWNKPPVRVLAAALEPNTQEEAHGGGSTTLSLVPVGATTLRRTCFTSVPPIR